jgi:SagB-type dehydrogenase family enzyme
MKNLIFFLSITLIGGYYLSFSQDSNSQKSDIVNLPQPKYDSEISVEEALLNRRSIRSYSQTSMTIEQISQLLWSAYGITRENNSQEFYRGGFRTAPSAGALYPLEIYIATGNVSDLKKGIYKYNSIKHQLEMVVAGDIRDDLSKAIVKSFRIQKASVVIVFTAIFERTTQKYGQRGRERYVWIEVGHSAQNLYLQAYSLGVGMCVNGAFNDEVISDVLLLPANEEPVYLITMGVRK